MINGKYDITPYSQMTQAQREWYDIKERADLNPHSTAEIRAKQNK